MASTKDMIERQFDASAPAYDRTGPSVYAQFGRRLAEQVPLTPQARVLDVATGTGAALVPVALRLGPEGRATAIDLSGGMLQEAERAVKAAGLAHIELRKMDAERLEFPDEAFDAVLCSHGIFLFPDRDLALREIYRVTKAGGRAALSVFGNTPPAFTPAWGLLANQLEAYEVAVPVPNPLAYFTPEEMSELLTQVGFVSVEARSETSEAVYRSDEEWWAFLLTMAPRPALMSMDEDTRTRFQQEYFDVLRPLFGEDGLHLQVSMVYAVAQR